MFRFLSSLLLIYLVSGQSILKQESFRDSNIDIEENLIIGISKKRISLKKTPKRLSKKLDIVISKDDTVLIKEDQLFDNKKYIKVYTFNGETGWASRKHIKILEKKLEVNTLKEEIEKEVDSLRFEQLSRKIEKKSIQLKNNKPDSKTIIENKNLSPENDKIELAKGNIKKEKLIGKKTATEKSVIKRSKVEETKTQKTNYLVIFLLALLLCYSIYSIIKLEKEKKDLQNKIGPILDLKKVLDEKESEKKELDHLINEIKANYQQKKEIYNNLQREIAIMEEELSFIDFGVYKPRFDFGTSREYKEKITDIVGRQRAMVKEAIYSSVEVYVLDNKTKGNKLINTYKKIALKCFNNETQSVMKNVKANNIIQSEQKIQKSFKAVNDFLSSLKMYIKKDYLDLKIEELNARHEHAIILNEEREKIRAENARIREEERAQKEYEKAIIEEEEKEKNYQKALEEAKKQLGLSSDKDSKKLEEEIDSLKSQLEKIKEEKERVKSMAQMTKVGHVYIISNLGSFGEQVYKIGLTRRLEPMDRVKELGDASVPFPFDVHAMIFSENAPELESSLHKIFDDRRVNLVNRRKEYFRVDLDEIEKEVKKIDENIEFVKISEAIEYHQTKSILEEQIERESQKVDSQFPDSI